ncbi:hypothetical protein ACFQ61_08370 [Streptomyces sp. NPDC056500]|uniref:hypothetical protein n=1 Tax=Streptomyces sp. NPDC056500 TaxID=3345840 RepID=UPI00367534E2
MTPGKRPVTLGVYGSGEVASELVCDVLNDHFGMGAEDSEGYFAPSEEYALTVLLTADSEAPSPGVHTLWEWAIRCELPYRVVWDGTDNESTQAILENVAAPEDIVTVENCGAALMEELREGSNPLLLVISDNGQLDTTTADIAAVALRAGLPVYDIARALLEITWCHLPGYEPPAPGVETEADGQTALAVATEESPGVTLAGQDAVAIARALTQAEDLLDVLSENVAARIGTVRQSLIRARSVLAPRPKPAQVEGEEPSTKTRLEIFDPEKNEWVAAGRGRPPKGAEKRRVPA